MNEVMRWKGYNEISKREWLPDNSASGKRSRAFIKHGNHGWELIAYDDGRWEVRCGHTVAYGNESDGYSARKRSVVVFKAMIIDLEGEENHYFEEVDENTAQ